MQRHRRQFLAGLIATGLVPRSTWADAGSPSFLSAAALPDGSYVLCGIDDALNVTFQQPLPARGHAAAAHPTRPEAVAFARRPGTFAVVVDCASGAQKSVLNAPFGRHFYGHGTFSEDGSLLFTTENDFGAGRGVIGVWDVTSGYARVGEWDSGGIGPHDIKRLPHSDILVVANGGIDTHPDTGRTKLNLPTIRPNLSYVADGRIVETAELSRAMHKNSIRHLAVSTQGQVAFGMQWQGDGAAPSVVGYHSLGRGDMALMPATSGQMLDMQGYVGSIAFSENAETVAVTSPRGGLVQFYDLATAQITEVRSMPDVCGIAAKGAGIVVTSGTGDMMWLQNDDPQAAVAGLRWDNHLIPV